MTVRIPVNDEALSVDDGDDRNRLRIEVGRLPSRGRHPLHAASRFLERHIAMTRRATKAAPCRTNYTENKSVFINNWC